MSVRSLPTAIAIVAGVLTVTLASKASAQATPPQFVDRSRPQAAASTGRTELSPSTLATPSAEDEEEQYVDDGSLSLGGLFTSGNARAVAITTAARLRLRRYEHQFAFAAAANFARAAPVGERAATTVENYQGLGRYEYFVSPRVSLFLQSITRRDRFQGLDLRLNVDPGVAYHFIQTKRQQLVVEAGYDLQHDVRRDELRRSLVETEPGAPDVELVEPKTRTLHNARAYLGYENALYPEVSFVSSLEYIQSFEDEHLYRMVFDVGLKSTIRERLAIAATYTVRYENRPLPGLVKADSLASLALVYTLF